MTRTMINLTFAATLLLGGNLALVRGDESGSLKPAEPQPQFAVFTSYGCSRSFQMDSAHASLGAAIQKAQSMRKDKVLAWVVTGKPGTDPQTWASFQLIPGRRQGLKFESCSVYESQCRGGWQMKTTGPSAEQAESLVAEMQKAGSIGEVVYRLASK